MFSQVPIMFVLLRSVKMYQIENFNRDVGFDISFGESELRGRPLFRI